MFSITVVGKDNERFSEKVICGGTILDLAYINQMLNRQSLYLGSCGYEDVELEFDVTPHDYLEFMEEDLKGGGRRNLINALSNAKRALDCQIESLLYGYCLKTYTDKKNMGIPNKIELLNKIGIIAPRILRKINKVRNTMEHDFYCPNIDEVQDFADVILLFISYTDKYLYEIKYDCELLDDKCDFYCIPEFNRGEQEIIVDVRNSTQEKNIIKFEAGNETIELFIEF